MTSTVLFAIAAGWLGGLLCASLVDLGGLSVAFGIAGLAFGLAGAAGTRWMVGFRCRIVALAAGALCAGLGAGRDPTALAHVPAGLCRIEAQVLRSEPTWRGSRSRVEVISGRRLDDGAPLPTGARLEVLETRLPVGARVAILAQTWPLVRYRNISPHPDWPSEPGVVGFARLASSAPRILGQDHVASVVEKIRDFLRRRLDATLPTETAAFARALVLGERNALRPKRRGAVRDAGLAHILAISGLHITLLAGAFVRLTGSALRWIRPLLERGIAPRLAAAMGIPFALAAAGFTGGAPSAWRAAVTASLGWLLVSCGYRPSAPRVAGAATVLLSACEPSMVLAPGFLLSVLATAAILCAADSDRTLIEVAGRVSLFTAVATAPMLLWCFGSVPLIGVAANLVLTPVASVILVPFAAMHLLVSVVVPVAAPATGAVFATSAKAFFAACEAFSNVDLGRGLPPPDLLEGVILATGCIGLVLVKRRRFQIGVALLLALGLALAEARLRWAERSYGELRVTAIDVGQGDSILVDLPDGRAMLIDSGGGAGKPGERSVLPLLRARRRARLDVVVVTHPHPDHYGGLVDLMDRIEIGEIWDSGQAEAEDPSGQASRLLAKARARGISVRYPSDLCARARNFAGVRVEALWPCPEYDPGYDPNDNSLVLTMSFGARTFLLTGDIEKLAEGELVRSLRVGRLRADVLKVPHHGSRTSTTAEFLAAVDPQVALISSGVANRFGHPHREVLERLRANNVRVFRLDQVGGVVVVTDGQRLEVHAWDGTAAALP